MAERTEDMTEERKGQSHLRKEPNELRSGVAAREQTEGLLKQSNRSSEELLEGTGLGLYRTTPDGHIIMANAALLKMLGYSSFEELSTRNLAKEGFAQGYPRSTFLELIARQGKVENLHSAWLRRDGTTAFVIENARVIRDESGKTLYYEGIVRDSTAQKQAYDALEQSEQLLSLLFEAVTESVLLIKTDGTILAVNGTAANRLGESVERLIGRNVYDLLPQETGQYRRAQVERVVRTGQQVVFEDTRGSRHFLSCVYPAKDAEGKVTKVAIFAMDITKRKEAEDDVRRNEAKYRTLVENLPQRIFLKDRNLAYISCNENYAKDLGIKSEEIAGKTDFDFYPKKLAEHYRADDKKVIEEGTTQDIEEGYIQHGRELFVHTVKTPFRDEQGNVVGVLGIFWDVTAQRAMQEAMKIRDAALASSINGIALCDSKGILTYVNTSFLQMWGYENDSQVLGKAVQTFWKNRRQALDVMKTLRHKPGWVGELTAKRKDGALFDVQVVASRVTDDKGRILCMLASFVDITEQKRAKETLDAYHREMVRAEQLASLGVLGSTLSHGLTQPLTTVRLSIENALEDLRAIPCPSAVAENLQASLRGVTDAISVVQQYRTFARKAPEKAAKAVDLGVVFENVAKLLDESAWRARITVESEGMDVLPGICADQKRIEQLFFALVQNAIEAADGKREHHLIVSGVAADEHVELRFADDCCGIAPDKLDKIFEPFFTTKPVGRSTGLGLCLVRQIVSEMGGSIRVTSKVGKGSTFFVTLPIGLTGGPNL